MRSSLRSQLTPKQQRIGVQILIWSTLIAMIIGGYWVSWTGFDAQPLNPQYQREKTLWDWLELLIVPAALAYGAIYLNRAERRNELQLAAQREAADRQSAAEEAQETALQVYLDRMADLLLTGNLRRSEANAEGRNVARTHTLTVLRRLDGRRKGLVLLFLYEAGLISGQDAPILDLAGADLTGAVLEGANLQYAHLANVDLSNANLYKARLDFARLTRTKLQGVNLCEASFDQAVLEEANLNGANCTSALFRGSDLTRASAVGADFTEAMLYRAIFQYLGGAGSFSQYFVDDPAPVLEWFWARHKDDHFKHMNTGEAEFFDQVKSLSGAVLPDGSKHA